MRTCRTLSLTLSVIALCAGLWLAGLGDGTTSPGVMIGVIRDHLHEGGSCSGIAMEGGGGDVEVTATIDGEELDGAPDDTMEGGHNEFSFPIPPGSSGKQIKIVAMAADGRTTTTYVHVR